MAKLSAKQQVFIAAYIGEAKGNATAAARIAGYKQPRVQGSENLTKPAIREAIDEHLAEIKARGIADKQNRIDAENDRHRRLQQIIDERAIDPWVADVPGGTTGLIVKQLKTVKHVHEPDPSAQDGKTVQVTVEIWEATVDTALLREMRELEKQVAQERGEWTERQELQHTGKDGQAIEFVYREIPAKVVK
jgi:phage terminase small subunit